MDSVLGEWDEELPPWVWKGFAPALRQPGFRIGSAGDPDQLLLEFVTDAAQAGGWSTAPFGSPAPDLALAHPERGVLFAVCRPMGDLAALTDGQREWLEALAGSGAACIVVTRSDSEALGRWLEGGDSSAAELAEAWRAAVRSLGPFGYWAELAGAWVPTG